MGNWRVNVLRLVFANALGGCISPAMVAVAGIIGLQLAYQPWQATFPLTSFTLGMALAAYPAALFMQKVGRGTGLLSGCVIGLCGLAILFFGVKTGSFLLLCGGALVVGCYVAFILQIRFAVLEIAGSKNSATALGWVMGAGVVTAIVGPQAVIFGKELLATTYTGVFLLLAVLVGCAMLCIVGLQTPQKEIRHNDKGRSLKELISQPMLVVAVLNGVSSFGIMILVMTAAPLAMHGVGHSDIHSFRGIQWHVIAMFLPSFITGKLIKKNGPMLVIQFGLVILIASAVVFLLGITVYHFWAGLILLGLGWNLAFMGATFLLGLQHKKEEAGKVQGFNDFCVFSCNVVASLFSGVLLHQLGWETINMLMIPLIVALVSINLLVIYRGRKLETA